MVSIGLIPAHAGKTIGARTWPPPRPAHPRSRGENWATCVRRSKQGGSSPLTRGKLGECRGVDGPGGLIPAHAGKTFGPYPADDREAGSSPLTRGKRGQERGCYFVEGLIPAHAGKTPRTTRRSASRKAHPRSRGENHGEHFGGGLIEGSSPLTRGKHGAKTSLPPGPGLIPAHAGKTRSSVKLPYCLRAHPRSRGENSAAFGWINGSLGSSPLTRGKLLVGAGDNLTGGLIPAHAGKTRTSTVSPSVAGAHPRSRGENSSVYSISLTTPGSSPLTRGKHLLTRQRDVLEGLIPAHAGKTSRRMRPREKWWAHPRSRGENGAR